MQVNDLKFIFSVKFCVSELTKYLAQRHRGHRESQKNILFKNQP